jgi:hypothetical protein
MGLVSFIVFSMYIWVGIILSDITFHGHKHSNCNHGDYIDTLHNSLHMLVYFVHGLVWYTTEDNIFFVISLCVYFAFSIKYLGDGTYAIGDSLPILLLICVGIHAFVLYWEYGTYVGGFSFILHAITLRHVSKLHKQCCKLVQIQY